MTSTSSSSSAPERLCGWCDQFFPIIRRPGRPKIYCSHSCRQRAYERRRGLGVLPPPDRIIMQAGGPTAHLAGNQPPGYEGGQTSVTGAPDHALRPSGLSDGGGRRLTLCGTLAHPTARRFSTLAHHACRTCAMVEQVRPSARPIRLSADLAAVRSLIDAAAIEFNRQQASNHPVKPAGDILADLLEQVDGSWTRLADLAA